MENNDQTEASLATSTPGSFEPYHRTREDTTLCVQGVLSPGAETLTLPTEVTLINDQD